MCFSLHILLVGDLQPIFEPSHPELCNISVEEEHIMPVFQASMVTQLGNL